MNRIELEQQRHVSISVCENVYMKYYIFDTRKPIVITFANASVADRRCTLKKEDVDKDISPWAYDLIVSLKLNVISFASINEPCWYRSSKLDEFICQLAPKINIFPQRLGYGDSMGAYGVSAFSNTLNIERLLLLYPISTLNKSVAPFVRGREKAINSFDWQNGINDGAKSTSKGLILYDPLVRIDNLHQSRYSKKFERIRCVGLGHGFIGLLGQKGILKQLLVDFISDEVNVNIYRKKVKELRHTEKYYKNLLPRCKDRDLLMSILKNNDPYNFIPNILAGNTGNTGNTGNNNGDFLESDIDYIRDLAIKYENIDIKISIVFMRIALKLRPEGLYIKSKLQSYMSKGFGKDIYETEDVNFLRDFAIEIGTSDLDKSIRLLRLASKLRPKGEVIQRHLTRYLRAFDNDRTAILCLLFAGIGDILNQINQFLWVCDELNLKPLVYIDSSVEVHRNSISDTELLTLFGLSGLITNQRYSNQLTNKMMTMEDCVNAISNNEGIFPQEFVSDVYIKFTRKNGDYSKLKISQLNEFKKLKLKNEDGAPAINPRLSNLVSASELYKVIKLKRAEKDYTKIALHIRRGDIAQFQLSSISHLIDKKKYKDIVDKVAHITGLYLPKDIPEKLPKGHAHRFATINSAKSKLLSVMGNINPLEKVSIVLLSDGYTRLAQVLHEKYGYIFEGGEINVKILETNMSKELEPLMVEVDNAVVGEDYDLLKKTLVEGLSADIIVTSSPSLFKYISLAMGINIIFHQF